MNFWSALKLLILTTRFSNYIQFLQVRKENKIIQVTKQMQCSLPGYHYFSRKMNAFESQSKCTLLYNAYSPIIQSIFSQHTLIVHVLYVVKHHNIVDYMG